MKGERKGRRDLLKEESRKAESEIKRNGKAESEERNLERQRQ